MGVGAIGGEPFTPQTARGRATRRALLDAAESVFGERTFDEASVSEITRRAGVAQGTFYTHFPDKTAIFVELVRELSRGMRAAATKAIEGVTDRLEVERKGFAAFFDYIDRHRAVYRLIREAEFVEPEVYRAHYLRLAEGYARGLRRAILDGQLPADLDPEVAAYCLMGMGDFVGMRWVLWGDTVPVEVFEQMMRFAVGGLLAGGSD
jgi:AcrR family transcriptional regulator